MPCCKGLVDIETKIHLAERSWHSGTEFERHSRKKKQQQKDWTQQEYLFGSLTIIRHRHNMQPNVVQQTKSVNEILKKIDMDFCIKEIIASLLDMKRSI